MTKLENNQSGQPTLSGDGKSTWYTYKGKKYPAVGEPTIHQYEHNGEKKYVLGCTFTEDLAKKIIYDFLDEYKDIDPDGKKIYQANIRMLYSMYIANGMVQEKAEKLAFETAGKYLRESRLIQ